MAAAVRFVFSLLVVWVGFSASQVFADEPTVVPGVITAMNVDVTADDGSLLPERLNVGDSVYIVEHPQNPKKGWVRITKSPTDTVGIGWVEAKNIRSFERWQSPPAERSMTPAEKIGEKTVYAPDVEETKYGQIGILPFVLADGDDPLGKSINDLFSLSLRNDGHFKVNVLAIDPSKTDIESTDELRRVTRDNNLDGVFVGRLSSSVQGNRLLQVKFFGRDRESFVLEKVKRIPQSGNLKEVVESLVADCVGTLTKK
ncbi:MAG TPA: hypothetical protein VI895_00370 [Bdellovibrionota bacterium]|nr:hypothetical protein [Bdellovibrionota bacterium]